MAVTVLLVGVVPLFSRNAYRVVLIVVAVIALVQVVAVIRTTTWPIEQWFGAW